MNTNDAQKQPAPLGDNPGAKWRIELPPGGVALADVEKELVRQAMERAAGNQTHAAQLLGIERDALRRRLVKYGFIHHLHVGGVQAKAA